MDLVDISDKFFKEFPINETTNSKVGRHSSSLSDITVESPLFDNNSTLKILNQLVSKPMSGDISQNSQNAFERQFLNLDQSPKDFKPLKTDFKFGRSAFPSLSDNSSNLSSIRFPMRKIGARAVNTPHKLTEMELEMLEMKIYLPYFISYATLIEYQDSGNEPKKLSIMDILQTYFIQKKTQSRLYFKVNMSDEPQE